MKYHGIIYRTNSTLTETNFLAKSANDAAEMFAKVCQNGFFTVISFDEYKTFLANNGELHEVLKEYIY